MIHPPRGHDVELLLVAARQGRAVAGGVPWLRAPGARGGLQARGARLLAYARVLAEQVEAGATRVPQRVLGPRHVRPRGQQQQGQCGDQHGDTCDTCD